MLQNVSSTTSDWIISGAEEMVSLFTSSPRNGKTISALMNDFILPNNLIFGDGGDPNSFGYTGIDVGYVRLIWMFGIVGTILLFIGYVNMFIISYKNTIFDYGKAIIISICVLFFVYLFKLFPIYVRGGNIILFGLPIVFMVCSQNAYDPE